MDNHRNWLQYVGNLAQIGGVKRYKMIQGLSKNMEVIEINNGNGLIFTILPDKCLDIFNLSFKGHPISYISPSGLVSPLYYDSRGNGWLKTFGGGLFVTCGLTNVGEPCTFEGTDYGLHGNISQISADEINVSQQRIGDEFVFEVSGKIRQVKTLVENIVIERNIRCILFENEIRVTDTISNQGATRRPFMILYHMNFGYPLVNPESELIVPIESTLGFDEYAEKRKDKCLDVPQPFNSYVEETYIHNMRSKNNRSGFCIINDKHNPEYGVSVTYPTDVLNHLGQNNCFREKDYFVAFEPCNNEIKGAEYENGKGTLRYLEPDETIKIELIIKFDTNTQNLKETVKQLK